MPDATPEDPGYGRDEDLERLRGSNRPAHANIQPHKLDDDPNPDRHIHFSPDLADPETPA